MRALALAPAVILVALACSSSSGSAEQDLASCLPGWWHTTPGACSIDPACQNAQGQLQAACQAADCASLAVYGFSGSADPGGAGNGYWQGTAIWSQGARLLCASHVVAGRWATSDGGVQLTVGASTQTVAATCAGTDSQLAGVTRTRFSSEVAQALDARGADGGWDECSC